jgi:murein DD-endopeptidase MepM/ murein hydrolase activator NlpD
VVTVESGTEEPKTHIVKRGENLYRIGLKYGVTVDELKEWNGLSDINIREGQVLVLMYIPFSTPDRQPEQVPIIGKKAIMPVDNGKVFSEFGMRNKRLHKGIDLGSPPGTPIYAVLPGTVIFAGRQRGYGNVVIIQHDESIITVYAHNESNRVSVNDRVTQGQIIATVGNTGNTRAYHVHFEYRFQGVARNPRELLPL